MEEKRVGSIVLATDQGLGYMAKEFFDNGIIQKVFIYQHSSRPAHLKWYPASARVSTAQDLLKTCDTLLFFETPLVWKIIPMARDYQVKTVLMPMYECTPYPLPYEPDVVLSPSLLDHKYYPDSYLINVPVQADWKLRERARVFVHNAGNGGLGGRNGTKELLEAMQYVKSPIELIIRSQVPLTNFGKVPKDPRIKYITGTFGKKEIFAEGDVFIFPEKFNGLSLPLQEAFASGMLVMAGDRFPMNTWLPKEPLIPVDSYKKEKIAVEFDSAIYTPTAIARTIDNWYNKDITKFSLLGKEFNQNNSWEKMKQKYMEYL